MYRLFVEIKYMYMYIWEEKNGIIVCDMLFDVKLCFIDICIIFCVLYLI